MRRPLSWIVVSSAPPHRGEEPLLVEAMRRAGARTVEREGERFAGYFPRPPDVQVLLQRVAAAIRASTSLADPDLLQRPAAAAEWARLWGEDALTPTRITDRLFVAAVDASTPGPSEPSFEDAEDPGSTDSEVPPGRIVVRLRPGPFFGTAEHATTRSCLRLLDGLVHPGDRILDVGAGSGILAVASALLGAAKVEAVEMDPVACAAVRQNVDLNGVEDRVGVRVLRADSSNLPTLGTFDGAIANLQAEELHPLVSGLASVRHGAGWLLLSGATEEEAPAIVEAARHLDLREVSEVREGGWWTGVFGP